MFVFIAKYILFAHGKKIAKLAKKSQNSRNAVKIARSFSAKWFQSLILREGEGSSGFCESEQKYFVYIA